MTRGRPNPAHASGFVLAEALVALVLLGLTTALVVTGLAFGRRVNDAGRDRERLAQAASGFDSLADWLVRASPLVEISPLGEPLAIFDGTPKVLTFLTVNRGDALPGGLVAVRVMLHDGRLLFEARTVPAGSAAGAPVTAPVTLTTLVAGVDRASFLYFGSPSEGRPVQWYDEWQAAARLPRLVALRARVYLQRAPEEIDLTFRVRSE